MKTLVLDTNILIDHVHGFARWLDDLLTDPAYRLVIPTIVVAEYLTAQEIGAPLGRKTSINYLTIFIKQDLNFDIAEILGTILRKRTYPPQADLSDLIIAATSIYLKAKLATRNKSHFTKIPKLNFFKQG